MDARLRILRIVHAAMLLAAVVYVFLAEYLRRQRPVEPLNQTAYLAIALVAAAIAVASFLVRRSLIDRSFDEPPSQGNSSAAVFRWFGGYVVVFAMCEAIVLLGFILRFMGANLSEAALLYAVGILLFLLFSPRKPEGGDATGQSTL